MAKNAHANMPLGRSVRSKPVRQSEALQRSNQTIKLNRLRCQLRAVNIEYSSLVRGRGVEAAYARMAEIRAERHLLIRKIAKERQGQHGLVQRVAGLRPKPSPRNDLLKTDALRTLRRLPL
jgi:hypothetical protein